MFWDVWESFLDLFDLTIHPSLKNLFSSKKNFIGMFLAVFILETLLSVICIAGVDNINEQREIVRNYTAYTEKISDAEEKTELDKNIEVILNSTGILTGALAIWWLSAITVYWKMTTSAAERNKFIWGLYITYGAAKKKIHRMLGTEMYLTLAAGMAAGWPVALIIYRYASGGSVRGSVPAFFMALVIAFISVSLCISLETAILTSKTCEKLLDDEGSAGNFVSPRRSGNLTHGFTPWRYAVTSVLRMRKYYIALAFAAAVPVIIWVCCQTASVSETAAISENIDEFKITSSSGIDGEVLQSDYYDELGLIDGVASVSAVAAGKASELGTHILLDPEQTVYPSSCAQLRAVYADGEATIAVADDPVFLNTGGYEFEPMPVEGEVVILLPESNNTYNYTDLLNPDSDAVDYIMIAVSKSSGEINIVDGEMKEYLDGQINGGGEYEYLRLKIIDAATCYSIGVYSGSEGITFLYVQQPYFLLNVKDYERITGIPLKTFECTVPSSSVIVDTSLYADGTMLMTIPADSLSFMPSAGQIIAVDYRVKPATFGGANITADVSAKFLVDFINEEGVYADKKSVTSDIVFKSLYIQEVTEKGGLLYLRVAPRSEVDVFRFFYSGYQEKYSMVFGTPELASTDLIFVARTYNQDFNVIYHSITLGDTLTFLSPTEVRAADVGSHILFEAPRIKDTTGCLLLDPVYVTNQFTLACADGMTAASLGLGDKNITVENGTATIVMPETPGSVLSLEVGQKLRIAYIMESTVSVNVAVQSALDPLYQLEQQLKTNFRYAEVIVGKVITAPVDQPYIFIVSDLYSDLLGMKSAYDIINLSIRPDLTPSEYNSLTAELRGWSADATTPENKFTLAASGKYVGILLRSAADYRIWLSVIALMTPLLIPLVWYYPQSMVFARRRSDYDTLLILGRKKKDIRKVFAYESFLAAVLAVTAAVILCPAGMTIFGFAVVVFELPIEFRFAAFDMPSMLWGCLATGACAALTVWLGYFTVIKKSGKHRWKGLKKKNANT